MDPHPAGVPVSGRSRASGSGVLTRSVVPLVVAFTSVSMITACSGPAQLPAAADCAAVAIEPDRGEGTEAKATATEGGSVWARFLAATPMAYGGPARVGVGEELEIVWRATGTGPFVVVAQGPDGQRLDPDWGPELHAGSSWPRPGDEWGTGWTIPDPGCWTFSVIRDDVRARLGVQVDPA